MGRLRAANGHPDTFPVRWWAVGNEMFGQWQLGYMPLAEYVKKHNAVADTLRLVDPAARLVAVGSVGAWDEGILAGSAGHMDLISEHIYHKELAEVDAHSRQLADDIDRIALAHRGYRSTIPALKGRDIRIAMDEWNYWYGPYVYGELGVQYHLKDALGIARGLHAFFRNSAAVGGCDPATVSPAPAGCFRQSVLCPRPAAPPIPAAESSPRPGRKA